MSTYKPIQDNSTEETPLLFPPPRSSSISTRTTPSSSVSINYTDAKDASTLSSTQRKNEWLVVILMILVIASGAANSVARKIMTKPMGNYSLFVTLFSAAAYFILYHSILLTKVCLGLVPIKTLGYPWRRRKHAPSKIPEGLLLRMWKAIPPVKYFIIIGFLECTGNILQVVATQYLSGPMVSLLGQTTIFFSMIVSLIMFNARYSWLQVLSVFMVVGGAMIPLVNDLLMTPSGPKPAHAPAEYYFIMVISSLPMTISFGIKEMIFRRERKLDVFIVNSAGSLFQLLWWPVALPITIILHQTEGLPVLTYLEYAFKCFTGHNPPHQNGVKCGPNPYPYLVYLAFNLVFNVFVLLLIKRASAVQSFMALNGVLPLAIVLFCVRWPLIGKSSVDVYVIVSLIVVMIGLVFYRWSTVKYERKKLIETTTLNPTGSGDAS